MIQTLFHVHALSGPYFCRDSSITYLGTSQGLSQSNTQTLAEDTFYKGLGVPRHNSLRSCLYSCIVLKYVMVAFTPSLHGILARTDRQWPTMTHADAWPHAWER
jgi:hypothetical protein